MSLSPREEDLVGLVVDQVMGKLAYRPQGAAVAPGAGVTAGVVRAEGARTLSREEGAIRGPRGELEALQATGRAPITERSSPRMQKAKKEWGAYRVSPNAYAGRGPHTRP